MISVTKMSLCSYNHRLTFTKLATYSVSVVKSSFDNFWYTNPFIPPYMLCDRWASCIIESTCTVAVTILQHFILWFHITFCNKYRVTQKPHRQSSQVEKVLRISQDSAATRLRCGGIFIDDFVTDLLESPTGQQRKNFENLSVFGEVTNSSKVASCWLLLARFFAPAYVTYVLNVIGTECLCCVTVNWWEERAGREAIRLEVLSGQLWTDKARTRQGDVDKLDTICCLVIANWVVSVDNCLCFTVILLFFCLQCFDTVGWVAGRASGL